MRRLELALVIMAAILLSPAVPAADDTLVGELVCAACYRALGSNGRGPAHAKCANACALKNMRVALVTATGDVYMVTGVLAQNNNAILLPLLNRQVTMTGTVSLLQAQDTTLQGTTLQDTTLQTATVQDTSVQSSGLRHGDGGQGEVTIQKRTGDFREGDVLQGTVKIIQATTVNLVVKTQ